MPEKLLLIRYDTEKPDREMMRGFFEKAVEVHRRERIPASFFCRGAALEAREAEFRWFYEQIKGDPLFDIQDHSYSHIGLGYAAGKPVEVLRADYEKSFATHERVFGVRPTGISICGTAPVDGERLAGFDATAKSRAELDMVASLGVRMINAFLTGRDESGEFLNFGSIGHPEIMGFPSAYSDTGWMYRWREGRRLPDPVGYILNELRARSARGQHLSVMLHDWVAWRFAPDEELSHVRAIAAEARRLGYRPVTHRQCLDDRALWS